LELAIACSDVVELFGDRMLRVIDRKSNVVKLRNGEFIAPDPFENLFVSAIPWLRQVYIYADPQFSCISAAAVLDMTLFVQWLESVAPQLLVGCDSATWHAHELCQNAQVVDIVLAEFLRVAQPAQLRQFEIPRCVLLTDQPFTVENALLTTNGKLARPQLREYFAPKLQALCAAVDAQAQQSGLDLQIELHRMLRLAADDASRSTSSSSSEAASSSSTTTATSDTPSDDRMLRTPLQQLGIDSVSATRILGRIKQQYGVQPPLSMLHEGASLADLISYATQAIRSSLLRGGDIIAPSSSMIHASELADDAKLPLDIQRLIAAAPEHCATEAIARPVRSVLLTGATGFLGSFLLAEILNRLTSVHEVHCLVRASSTATAMQRIRQSLQHRRVWCDSFAARIRVVCGDLTKPHLGLSSSDFNQLAHSIDAIYHNGAWVNSILPYRVLRASNVDSTIELIKLALMHKFKPLHYVSTVGVFGQYHASDLVSKHAVVPVDGPTRGSGYDQSKWVAEKLVLGVAVEAGLPITIHRPGLITAHSVTYVCSLSLSLSACCCMCVLGVCLYVLHA
jgi:fatty acid CoA ligase FadD9